MQPRDLAIAVQHLNENQVKELLSQRVSPSLLINNTTALHEAVQKRVIPEEEQKALRILALLLASPNCDINQMAAYRTVMNLAGHNSFWRAVLLIAQEKKTDAQDRGHYGSALIDVVRFCDDEPLRKELVRALLRAGALLNRYSETKGYNVLHWCVDKGYLDLLELFLKKSPEAAWREGGCGKTPARLAYELQKWDCLSVIGNYCYWPHINGEKDRLPKKVFNALVDEKEIIFKYVCRLQPLEEQLQVIRDGQNDLHILGVINNRTRGFFTLGDTRTIDSYRAREVELQKEIAQKERESQSSQFHAPSLFFQSAPRQIPSRVTADNIVVAATPEWIDMGYIDGEKIKPSAPIPIKPSKAVNGGDDKFSSARSAFSKWLVPPLTGGAGSSPEDDKNTLTRRLSSSPQ